MAIQGPVGQHIPIIGFKGAGDSKAFHRAVNL